VWEVPRTRYTLAADGVHLAYQVVGEGTDLFLVGDWTVPLEGRWDEPRMASPLRRLSSFSRVITFDRRGTGLSDPVALVDISTMEHWAEDIATVMDAVGAALRGHATGPHDRPRAHELGGVRPRRARRCRLHSPRDA
jgi:pimeloyl-ACP methyl ester carboxylesterase